MLFHSPPGVLFTFPSQYSALSVTKWYLALRGGPRVFPQDSSCPAVLWILPRRSGFAYGALTLSGRLFQDLSAHRHGRFCSPDPAMHARRFGLLRVRSPLLTESLLFSFPLAT